MITVDDVLLFFPTLLQMVLLAFVISRVITFIPSFMLSFLRSVNKEKEIGKPLETTLDKSDFGLKTLMNRWF